MRDKIPSEFNIRRIYLMLGQSCNFNCKYCIQSNIKNNKKQELSQDTVNYINHLIKIRPDNEEKLNILFWGGEPLIYFNLIQDIISMFGDKCTYGIVTNGSLLTDYMVKYFNDNDVSVALSYDGVNTIITRKIDIGKNKSFVELFNKLKYRSIDSVLSAYNCDYKSLYDNVISVFGNIPITIETLNVTWDMPSDLYKFDLDKYRYSLEYASNVAYNDILNGNITFYTNIFYSTLMQIAYRDNASFDFIPKCEQFYNSLNLDLQGNIYACHNCNDIISNTEEDRIIGANIYQSWLKQKFDNKCIDCKYLYLCKGGCPLTLKGHKGNEIMCKVRQIYYQTCIDLAEKLNNYTEPVELEVVE